MMKPHNERVTCASYSPNGRLLATAGADGTVFLLRVSKGGSVMNPVGFVSTL